MGHVSNDIKSREIVFIAVSNSLLEGILLDPDGIATLAEQTWAAWCSESVR